MKKSLHSKFYYAKFTITLSKVVLAVLGRLPELTKNSRTF